MNVVDNSGTETTINAKKRLFYIPDQGDEGVICMALNNFEGEYNKETDTIEPISINSSNRFKPIDNFVE